jgi:hypothetical protein
MMNVDSQPINRLIRWCCHPVLLAVALCLILFAVTAYEPVSAQQNSDEPLLWSRQQRIPGYLDRTEPPILIADSTGMVHAFAYQRVGNPDLRSEVAIIYSTWTAERGWTLPTDIVLSPIKQQARVMDVYLDPQGDFHLVFYGGDEVEAYLYYTRAHVSQAVQATAWSQPIVIGERPLTPSLAKMVGDEQGNLVVLFSGNLDGPGLFMIRSLDNGETWGSPAPVFLTYDRAHRPFVMAMSWGESGNLHLVWHVVNERGHSANGYYAQMDLENGRWSKPILIDEGIGVEAGMGVMNPAIIEYNGKIIVAYNNGIPPDGVPPTNYYRISEDNGQTWTERSRISREHVGRNGELSFVVDSNNQLYLFFGGRIPLTGANATHGMWYVTWQGGHWSGSESVVSGLGGAGFDPYDARAVIASGNRLLATWRTDPGNSRPGVWFAHTVLNAPAVEPIPIPTPVTVMVDAEESGNEPTTDAAPDDTNAWGQIDEEESTVQTETSAVIYRGVLPSFAVVLLVLMASAWRNNRSQRRMVGK